MYHAYVTIEFYAKFLWSVQMNYGLRIKNPKSILVRKNFHCRWSLLAANWDWIVNFDRTGPPKILRLKDNISNGFEFRNDWNLISLKSPISAIHQWSSTCYLPIRSWRSYRIYFVWHLLCLQIGVAAQQGWQRKASLCHLWSWVIPVCGQAWSVFIHKWVRQGRIHVRCDSSCIEDEQFD